VDLAALHARASALEAQHRQQVELRFRIDPRLYAVLIETAEKHEVRLRDLVPRALALGLEHVGEFVPPHDERSILHEREFSPHRGQSRGISAYEAIVGQPVQPPLIPEDDDPLIAAALSIGQRRGMARGPIGPRRPATMPSTLDDEPEQQAEQAEA
jgi:hypothetical protein